MPWGTGPWELWQWAGRLPDRIRQSSVPGVALGARLPLLLSGISKTSTRIYQGQTHASGVPQSTEIRVSGNLPLLSI
jgi:hypothetical protein